MERLYCHDCDANLGSYGVPHAYAIWCPVEHAPTDKGQRRVYCRKCTYRRCRRFMSANPTSDVQLLKLRFHRYPDLACIYSEIEALINVKAGLPAPDLQKLLTSRGALAPAYGEG